MPGIVSIMTRHRENGPEGHLFRRPELQSDDEAGCPIELKGRKPHSSFLALGAVGARDPTVFGGSWGQSPYASRRQRAGFCIAKTMLKKKNAARSDR